MHKSDESYIKKGEYPNGMDSLAYFYCFLLIEVFTPKFMEQT